MGVFGRQMSDGMPILPGKYNPHNTLKELLQHRELALAKRHVAHHQAWSEHTTKLEKLTVGDKVFVQSPVGPNPKRWERTGTIIESKDYDQYVIKIDGTGRSTIRNRKFLRRLSLIPGKLPTSPLPMVPISVSSASLPPHVQDHPALDMTVDLVQPDHHRPVQDTVYLPPYTQPSPVLEQVADNSPPSPSPGSSYTPASPIHAKAPRTPRVCHSPLFVLD